MLIYDFKHLLQEFLAIHQILIGSYFFLIRLVYLGRRSVVEVYLKL